MMTIVRLLVTMTLWCAAIVMAQVVDHAPGGPPHDRHQALIADEETVLRRVSTPAGHLVPHDSRLLADDAAPVLTAPSTAVPAAIESNFDRSPFIVRNNAGVPGSSSPDEVGAFRFICQAGHLAWDDPIVWSDQPGKSHLHQFFGNTAADSHSTFASLRSKGDSTCMNKLNRSSYWMPAMLNAAGKAIRPDYISIYYKRRPASDPECRRLASGGCVGLPNGLKLIAGFDPGRAGKPQPENMVFYWMCMNEAGTHRDNLARAIADCDGDGQVMAVVNFGTCWNGLIDSVDHRSHVVQPSYGDWGYLKCPRTHAHAIPGLTQQMVWTIKHGDGAVSISSDHGATPGSTLHADYWAAWDEPTMQIWTAHCIDRMLSCSDGDLGNGTIMKRRDGFGYNAEPRLAMVPVHTLSGGVEHPAAHMSDHPSMP